MLFFSLRFLAFFALVFALYWALPRERWRVWLLLTASFVFYASWSRWLALVIGAGATVDWWIGRAMETARSERTRKALLALSIAGNVGQLCYFKYLNFFLGSFEQLLHLGGVTTSLPTFQILLPIGVSFYTFEAISYTVDVYRRTIRAERSLPVFLLFITFFPRLVAGPIIRGRNFLPQVRRRKRWSWPRIELGTALFLLGLAKKLALADRLALYADPVFAAPHAYSSAAVWTASVAFTLQVYCDLSGYSDMAIGLGHLLGYKLPRNFDLPYLAASVAETWRRWHMSLSHWFRDYVFLPLGGTRVASWRADANLAITMTLIGLWHGAAWHFIVFGMFHGVVLSIERATGASNWVSTSRRGHALRVARTFLIVNTGCVLFRSATIATAAEVYGRMLVWRDGLGLPLPAIGFWFAVAAIVAGHVVAVTAWRRRGPGRLPAPLIGIAQAALAAVTLVLTPATQQAFIYFQF